MSSSISVKYIAKIYYSNYQLNRLLKVIKSTIRIKSLAIALKVGGIFNNYCSKNIKFYGVLGFWGNIF